VKAPTAKFSSFSIVRRVSKHAFSPPKRIRQATPKYTRTYVNKHAHTYGTCLAP